ncbi:Hypothetical protein I595_346 [Croceitalea dokdonensis DOKDO 023]|uniref:DUF4251 domain-containing protein n=1 Tax=Croceitalea dokdonensis DOKDO 023 TaxID=1300341 RepID=A0A0P7AXD4_9FLAO|nr:DUF4251 domain-containing protein [Croceitalea dokdonensis]KPM33443.1 Hypothetical protein I595_346 [Croceitalea dokdonensis DOKDO 023]
MKHVFYLGTAIVLLLVSSCGANKKTTLSDQEIEAFTSKMEGAKIHFVANVANPLGTQAVNSVINSGLLPPGSNVGRIDLIGISNFLKIHGDSVSADLPYYGERQFGGGYNTTNIGITFDNAEVMTNLEFDSKKMAYRLQFQADAAAENYTVNGWLYPNGKATIFINSSQRNTIGYMGTYTVK